MCVSEPLALSRCDGPADWATNPTGQSDDDDCLSRPILGLVPKGGSGNLMPGDWARPRLEGGT